MFRNLLLVFCVALTVNWRTCYTSDCDHDCYDYSWRCAHLWDEGNCNDDSIGELVRYACPVMCNSCTPCSKSDGGWSDWEVVSSCHDQCSVGDIEVQVRSCNNPTPQHGGAYCEGDHVQISECSECSDYGEAIESLNNDLEELANSQSSSENEDNEFDSDGYKLFLRHTEQEISADEFLKLCQMPFNHISYTGDTSYENNPLSSQYRDPNFQFFFPFTTEVKVKIFDIFGDEFGDFELAFGELGDDHPVSFPDMFQKKYMSSSSVWSDFTSSHDGNMSPYFQGEDSWGRNFYFAKTHAGCHADEVWFMVHSGSVLPCYWDEMYRPYDTDKSFILYSIGDSAEFGQAGLARAQKLEIWYKASNTNSMNGFERVFKYESGAGVHALDYFKDGTTDPSADRCSRTASLSETKIYRDSDVQSKIEGASYVMLVVYAYDGSVVDSLIYSGTGDMESWMTHSNLKWNYFWQFDETQDQYYGVEGHVDVGRNFFINRNYGGCEVDAGWLVVVCLYDDGSYPCGSWEDFSLQNNGNTNDAARDRICQLRYSPSTSAQTWANDIYSTRGGTIEIYTMA